MPESGLKARKDSMPAEFPAAVDLPLPAGLTKLAGQLLPAADQRGYLPSELNRQTDSIPAVLPQEQPGKT